MSGKRRHASSHIASLRSRHHTSSKYEYALWQNRGSYSARGNIKPPPGTDPETPYSVTHFAIVIHDDTKEGVQKVTELAENGRQPDINVNVLDTTLWHKQYPELSFHDTEELKERHVLVCDASIKIMTEKPVE